MDIDQLKSKLSLEYSNQIQELENDNQSHKLNTNSLQNQIINLTRYKDNFDEVERERFNEIEDRYSKKLQLIEKIHKEKIEEMRKLLDKSRNECFTEMENLKDAQTDQIHLSKLEAKVNIYIVYIYIYIIIK